MSKVTVHQEKGYWVGRFQAMASPCEVIMEVDDRRQAELLLRIAEQEARRIEQKFSRYLKDNIIYQINNSNGSAVAVDEETANLLDYADQCYQISDGMFDITSGILRKAWHFDGSDNLPSQQQVSVVLDQIGWQKVSWKRPTILLKKNMEIDFGGIGKEYAVDRTMQLLRKQSSASLLVNFGGDVCVSGPRQKGHGWSVGIENPDNPLLESTKDAATAPSQVFELMHGGIATSGDARRFLIKDGVRYSHIINPKTGWPTANAPRSVTVAASSCTEAGILATLSILQGADAKSFLQSQGVTHWCID